MTIITGKVSVKLSNKVSSTWIRNINPVLVYTENKRVAMRIYAYPVALAVHHDRY